MAQAVPIIFDSRRRGLRGDRAARRQADAGAATWLMDAMSDDIIERLGFLRFEGATALVSAPACERLTAFLVRRGVAITSPPTIDWEAPIDPPAYDLIVTMGEFDTVNDLPGALIHLRNALAPGGLLLAAVTGAGTLPVLRQAMLAADGERPAARIHPQIDSAAASALLQRAGFARQVVDQYALTVRYASLERLVADLRDQGLTSVLTDRAPALDRAALARAKNAFVAHAEGDGKVSENFEILTLTAWKD